MSLETGVTALAIAIRDKFNLVMPRLLPSGGALGQAVVKTGSGNYEVGWGNPTAADPWTYIKLSSDFSTSSATAVDVTGFSFTPAAGLDYEIDGVLYVSTTATAIGPRPGLAWPTGLTRGSAAAWVAASTTALAVGLNSSSGAVLAPIGGLPVINTAYPSFVRGAFRTGATPSGQLRVQLASETAGTSVSVLAGSFIRYRTF